MRELYTHLNADELKQLTRRHEALQFQVANLESVHFRVVVQKCWRAVAMRRLTADEARNDVFAVMENSAESKYPLELPVELQAELEDVDRKLHPEEYAT